MRKYLLLGVLALAACANQTPAQTVADVQAAWPLVAADINLGLTVAKASPAVVKAVGVAETQIATEVQGLSALQNPTSLATVLADVQTLHNNLPPGTLNTTQEAEYQALIATITLLSTQVH